MSSYVKISYQTKCYNQALLKCIEYIGMYFGNDYDPLHGGIVYLARNTGTSRKAIRYMISSKGIKNSQMRQWRFKKNSYYKVYEYIINRLTYSKKGDHEEAHKLLHDLYIESNQIARINKKISDILVIEQKDMLNWSIDKPQYKDCQKNIEKILKTFEECDIKYNSFL